MKIEKNIPIPPGQRSSRYPWKEMEVGDSFRIDGFSRKQFNSLMTCGCTWAKRNNPSVKFIVRTENTGIRVWRIE